MARRRKLIKPADAVEVPVPDPKVVYEESPSVDQVLAQFMAMNLRDRWQFLLKTRNVPVTKTARPMMPKMCQPKAAPLDTGNAKPQQPAKGKLWGDAYALELMRERGDFK